MEQLRKSPVAQLKKVLDKAHESLNEFAIALLAANDNRIVIKQKTPLEESSHNDNEHIYSPFYVEELVYEEGQVKIYQSHNGQAFVFNEKLDLVEKEHILSKAVFCAKNPVKTEFWPITSVAREDVKEAGFNIENVSDVDMERLADKMEDAYVGNGFWDDLKIIAEELGFPKTLSEEEE